MKSKFLSCLLAAVMLSASVLTACDQGGSVDTEAPADGTQAQTESSAPEGKPDDTAAPDAEKEPETEAETEYVYTPDPNNKFTGGVGLTQYGTSVSYASIKVTNNADRKVLLENSFDDAASLEGWNYFSRGSWDAAKTSDWAVTDGNLTFTDTEATGASIWTGSPDWGNYNLQVKGTAVEGKEGLGVYFAVKDDKNYSIFNIGGWSNSVMCVEQVVDGVATTTDKLPVHVNYGEEYNISVNVGAETINGYLNGEKIFQIGGPAPEKTYAGACGFSSWSTSVYYDNIKVVDFYTGEVKYENAFDDEASIADIKHDLVPYSGGTYTNDPAAFVWEDGKLLNTDASSTAVVSYFGDMAWTNYIYTVDVMPVEGIEGTCILGPIAALDSYLLYNCGGWGNTKGAWQTKRGESGASFDSDSLPCTLEYDEWSTLSLVVLDYAVYSYVNGEFYQAFWWDFE